MAIIDLKDTTTSSAYFFFSISSFEVIFEGWVGKCVRRRIVFGEDNCKTATKIENFSITCLILMDFSTSGMDFGNYPALIQFAIYQTLILFSTVVFVAPLYFLGGTTFLIQNISKSWICEKQKKDGDKDVHCGWDLDLQKRETKKGEPFIYTFLFESQIFLALIFVTGKVLFRMKRLSMII